MTSYKFKITCESVYKKMAFKMSDHDISTCTYQGAISPSTTTHDANKFWLMDPCFKPQAVKHDSMTPDHRVKVIFSKVRFMTSVTCSMAHHDRQILLSWRRPCWDSMVFVESHVQVRSYKLVLPAFLALHECLEFRDFTVPKLYPQCKKWMQN